MPEVTNTHVGTGSSARDVIPRISLRPVTADDMEFLFRLYASTREQERRMFGMNDRLWDRFLRMQFNLQHTEYMRGYDHPSFDIILKNGVPIGKFYVDRGAGEFRLIDIALLPEFRRQGIAGNLIRDVLAESEEHGVPVGLHVEKLNPAMGLYHRLGFLVEEDRGVFWFMKRSLFRNAAIPQDRRIAADSA